MSLPTTLLSEGFSLFLFLFSLSFIWDEFPWSYSQDFNKEWEYDHGRHERHKCSNVVAKGLLHPELIESRAEIKSVMKMEVQRIVFDQTKFKNKALHHQQRKRVYLIIITHYKSSLGHWKPSTLVHLKPPLMKMAIGSRNGNTPQNLNFLRKMALHYIPGMTDNLSLNNEGSELKWTLNTY